MRSTRIKGCVINVLCTCVLFYTCACAHIICTELPPNLNLPIFLFWPLGTKLPNLKFANISGYTVYIYILLPKSLCVCVCVLGEGGGTGLRGEFPRTFSHLYETLLSVFVASTSPWSIKMFKALLGCCYMCLLQSAIQ